MGGEREEVRMKHEADERKDDYKQDIVLSSVCCCFFGMAGGGAVLFSLKS